MSDNYIFHRLPYVEFDHELSKDELMHWKYISKKKVNGKWRYYYDGQTSKYEQELNNIQEEGKNINEKIDKVSRKFDDYKYNSNIKVAKNKFNSTNRKINRLYNHSKKDTRANSLFIVSKIAIGSDYVGKLFKSYSYKGLNKIGKGTLDNKLDSLIQKGRKKVVEFLKFE